MFGNNQIRKPVFGPGNELEITEIFKTIQGEGPNAGQPAVFVRLSGCNLACKFCDTDFEDFIPMGISEILNEVKNLAGNNINLVVITGGEPMRQPIEKLCRELLQSKFRVQIETNGTLFRDLDERVEIVCSPKNTGSGYSPIRQDLLERITALKFLVSAENSWYREVGRGEYGVPVYVQPMDEINEEKNRANLELAAKIALENGYFLSLQQHKILGIR